MQRSLALFAFSALLIGAVFTWGSTRANDGQPEEISPSTQESQIRALVDWVKALEERLTELEKRDAPIRQADARDEQSLTVPKNVWQRRPESTLNMDDNESQQSTNGQKWSFKLLGHRN